MSEPMARVFPRLYRDSVALMALAASLERIEGAEQVGVVMATPANLDILAASGMVPPDLDAHPNDLLVSVRAGSEQVAEQVFAAAEAGLQSREESRDDDQTVLAATLDEGLAEMDASVVAISTPGTHAPVVAEQALRRGLHVFCFSDNVDVADEVALKRLAVGNGLLMMGPDCGTAVLDGRPLGFANVLPAGSVGMVAASGTGAQEIGCLLASTGIGVSQLIGVGGRDLSNEVGGLMTLQALDVVAADPATELLLVVSKPPAPDVADAVLRAMGGQGLPAVACFVGARDEQHDSGVTVCGSLEGAAATVASMLGRRLPIDGPAPRVIPPSVIAPPLGGVVGLYTGGTLAAEAHALLAAGGVDADIVDLGDDRWTAGRPHPMIRPELRTDHILALAERDDISTVLVDCVLGHGSHPDPAGVLADAVTDLTSRRPLLVLASVTGTMGDPQGLAAQRRRLEDAGIIVHGSNAGAVRTALALHAPPAALQKEHR